MAHVICTKHHCNVAVHVGTPLSNVYLGPCTADRRGAAGSPGPGHCFWVWGPWRALHRPTCGSLSSHVLLASEARILINISAFSCALMWMLLMIVGLPPYSTPKQRSKIWASWLSGRCLCNHVISLHLASDLKWQNFCLNFCIAARCISWIFFQGSQLCLHLQQFHCHPLIWAWAQGSYISRFISVRGDEGWKQRTAGWATAPFCGAAAQPAIVSIIIIRTRLDAIEIA